MRYIIAIRPKFKKQKKMKTLKNKLQEITIYLIFKYSVFIFFAFLMISALIEILKNPNVLFQL